MLQFLTMFSILCSHQLGDRRKDPESDTSIDGGFPDSKSPKKRVFFYFLSARPDQFLDQTHITFIRKISFLKR